MMQLLRRVDAVYTLLIRGMSALACVYLGLMMVVIVYYTSARSLSVAYSPYSFTFIEYGFIYVLMLGAPWLVRQRAHVFIELITANVGARVRAPLSRTVAVLSFLVCLVLAYYTGLLALEDYAWNRYDELRGQLDIPRWIITVALPLGFGLMAIEFLRFVFSAEPMHGSRRQFHD